MDESRGRIRETGHAGRRLREDLEYPPPEWLQTAVRSSPARAAGFWNEFFSERICLREVAHRLPWMGAWPARCCPPEDSRFGFLGWPVPLRGRGLEPECVVRFDVGGFPPQVSRGLRLSRPGGRPMSRRRPIIGLPVLRKVGGVPPLLPFAVPIGTIGGGL